MKHSSVSKNIYFYQNDGNISKIKENSISQKKVVSEKHHLIKCYISASIFFDSMNIYLSLSTGIVNDFLKKGLFSDQPKSAGVTSIFKKADTFDKINY